MLATQAPSYAPAKRISRRLRSLAVGLARQEYARVARVLSERGLDSERLRWADGALDLAERIPFDLLLVKLPLPDMEMQEFLDALRRCAGPTRHASLLLVAEDGMAAAAGAFVGRGANQVLRLSRSGEELAGLLKLPWRSSPRRTLRVPVRIEVPNPTGPERLICQAGNISGSGLLVVSGRRIERGKRFRFTFNLPGDAAPTRGLAEVVRHTYCDREILEGFGARFLSFQNASDARLQTWLKKASTPPVQDEQE